MKISPDFSPEDFLPLSSIKSYFSRRAKKLKEGKCVLGEIISDSSPEVEENVEPDDPDLDQGENSEEIDAELREKTTSDIISQIEKVPNLQKDEWVAVNMGSVWYPAQFEKYDSDQEELMRKLLTSFFVQFEIVCLATTAE